MFTLINVFKLQCTGLTYSSHSSRLGGELSFLNNIGFPVSLRFPWMMGSILILTAHPDNEVLGCGGTMAKLSARGTSVPIVFLGDGVYSRQGDKIAQQTELRTRRTR